MRKLRYVLPAVFLFGVSAAVGAQEKDPTQGGSLPKDSGAQKESAKNAAPITSAQSVATARNNQPVKLSGEIVSQKSRNQYVFSDGTGRVEVDIPSKALNGAKLSAGTKVEITGAVDTRIAREPKVEAKSVTVLASASPGGSSTPMREESSRGSMGKGSPEPGQTGTNDPASPRGGRY